MVLQDFQKRAIQNTIDPFLWIPRDVEMILHVRNPTLFRESLLLAQPLNDGFDQITGFKDVAKILLTVDSLAAKTEELYSWWKSSQLVFATHASLDATRADFYVQLTMPSKADNNKIAGFLSQTVFKNQTVTEGYLGNEDLFVVQSDTSSSNLYYVFRQNALVISSNLAKIGVEDLAQQSANSIIGSQMFLKLRNAAGRFSDNLYLSSGRLCDHLPAYVRQNNPINLGCEDLAGWQVWDIAWHSRGLFFTGFAQSETYGEYFIDNLSGQQQVETQILEYIPEKTSLFMYLGISNTELFSNEYSQWLEINKADENLKGQRIMFSDVTGLDPDSIPAIWNGELAWVQPSYALSNPDSAVLLLGTIQKEKLLEHPQLQLFITDANPVFEDSLLYAPQVLHSSIPGLIPLLSKGIAHEDYSYLAFLDQYLIAGKSINALITYLEAIKFNSHFTENEDFAEMKEFMQEGQNFLFYHSLKKEPAADLAVISGDSLNEGERKDLRSFSFQLLSSPGNMVFSNAMWLHRSEYDLSNPLLWETELNAPIHKGPFSVVNHNDGFPEFILQDVSNILYLLDQDGAILWQKEISGPIASNVYQVDIYKNERLQYLFNTRNYLHLIDRNGEYVRGYPMRLPSPASTGISVFDYEGNKNYRIIFPSENKMIYNYSLLRRAVAGWQYQPGEHPVNRPVQHLRIVNKDYLVVTDTTGTVYFLDRRGKQRLKPRSALFSQDGNSVFAHVPSAAKPHFIVAGSKGIINQVFTDGSVHKFSPDTLTEEYSLIYHPFSNENEKDLVFLHKGVLTVYNIASRLLFSLPLARDMNAMLNMLNIDGLGNYAAITDKRSTRLYLIDKEGEILSPFPLKGDTPFLIEKDEKGSLYLITGMANQLRKYHLEFKQKK